MEEDSSDIPWFRRPNSQLPYKLAKVFLPKNETSTLCHAAFFPWDEGSFQNFILPLSDSFEKDLASLWKTCLSRWRNVVAVCGGNKAYVFYISGHDLRPVRTISLSPPDVAEKLRSITWSLDLKTLAPLLVFAGDRAIVHVFNLEKGRMQGSLKGHGAPITSVTTSPLHPHLVSTTSRDRSTRIYDLSRLAKSVLLDMPEPGFKVPIWKNGGPALGAAGVLGENRSEEGMGRDVAVLMGGFGGKAATSDFVSGGHQDSVLNADFHPSQPLLATCGVDHAVKFWHIPKLPFFPDKQTEIGPHKTKQTKNPPPPTMFVEVLPLFSTDLVHRSRVQTVHWLTDEILVTKSSGGVRDTLPNIMYPGDIVVWKWLGLGKHIPEGEKTIPWGSRKVGGEYSNSRSWTPLARIPLNLLSSQSNHLLNIHRNINTFTLPHEDAPHVTTTLVALADSDHRCVVLINLALLADGREVPPFPGENEHMMHQEANTDMIERKELKDGDLSKKQKLTPQPPESGLIAPDIPHWLLPSWPHTLNTPAKQKAKPGKGVRKIQVAAVEYAAISPQGARWIVGVGGNGLVVLWSLLLYTVTLCHGPSRL